MNGFVLKLETKCTGTDMILSLYRKLFKQKYRSFFYYDLKPGTVFHYHGVKLRKETNSQAFCFETGRMVPFHSSIMVLHRS